MVKKFRFTVIYTIVYTTVIIISINYFLFTINKERESLRLVSCQELADYLIDHKSF